MSRGTVHQQWTEQIVTEVCVNCGMPFAMASTFRSERLADGREFYCPAGHKQWFTRRKDAEEQLRQERDRARRDRDNARGRARHLEDQYAAERRSKAAIKGHLTRLRNRIAQGVCPECDVQFEDVRAHIEAQHPHFMEQLAQREREVSP